MENNLQDKNYDVYVDATILGRHDPKAPKRALVAYVVDGIEGFERVKEVSAQETSNAEYEAILFAIRELKGKLKQFTVFCDHQSVVSEANKKSKDTPSTNPLLREIRKELVNSNSNIILQEFQINPAHTLLNKYLIHEKSITNQVL